LKDEFHENFLLKK